MPDVFVPPDPDEFDSIREERKQRLQGAADDDEPKRKPSFSAVVVTVLVLGAAAVGYLRLGELQRAVADDSPSGHPDLVNDIPPMGEPSAVPQPVAAPAEPSEGVATSDDAEGGEPAPTPPAERTVRVRLITWKEEPDATVVNLWGDGYLDADALKYAQLPGRILIKLEGIDWPYPTPVIEVESRELDRIRTGFHPGKGMNELHVVFDLADQTARLAAIEQHADKVELRLAPPPEEPSADEGADAAGASG